MAARELRKGVEARRRVLDAVVEAVGRQGLASLSVAEIGGAVGMSAGHVLYYFGTKDTLFIEALKHSEAQLDSHRAEIVKSADDPAGKLRRYLALYLPNGQRDARWALWIEVWNSSLTDPDLCAIQLELDAHWQRDLASIIAEGMATGAFTPADPGAAAGTIAALLDGLAVRTLTSGTGTGAVTPATALRMAEAACQSLLAP